jgi:hypothetical protein
VEKPLGRALYGRKGWVPKNGLDLHRFWQLGEHPFCCRRNAERYLIFPFKSMKWDEKG